MFFSHSSRRTCKVYIYIISDRITEVPEDDVYICESKYLENERSIRKLAKGLKVTFQLSLHLTIIIIY